MEIDRKEVTRMVKLGHRWYDAVFTAKLNKIRGFLISDTDVCDLYREANCVQLICRRPEEKGERKNEVTGLVLLGAFLFGIKTNANVEQIGLLELVDHYRNLSGLCSYSQFGFAPDSSLNMCFEPSGSLPMKVDLKDLSVADILSISTGGGKMRKHAICQLKQEKQNKAVDIAMLAHFAKLAYQYDPIDQRAEIKHIEEVGKNLPSMVPKLAELNKGKPLGKNWLSTIIKNKLPENEVMKIIEEANKEVVANTPVAQRHRNTNSSTSRNSRSRERNSTLRKGKRRRNINNDHPTATSSNSNLSADSIGELQPPPAKRRKGVVDLDESDSEGRARFFVNSDSETDDSDDSRFFVNNDSGSEDASRFFKRSP